jgi:hypothetical protein
MDERFPGVAADRFVTLRESTGVPVSTADLPKAK